MKKRLLATITAVVMLGAGFAAFALSRPATSLAAPVYTDTTPSVTAYGSGSTTTKPDTATLTVGAMTSATTAKEAQESCNKIADAMIKAAKASGLKEASIRTSNLSLYPNYDYKEGTNKINGYQANYTLTLIVEDIAKVGEILDAQVAAGANSNSGIYFGLKDDTAAYDAALKAAVADAKHKAEILAQATGKTLGDVVVIDENGGNSYVPVSYRASNMALSADSSGTPVMAEGIDVSANVTITYLLK